MPRMPALFAADDAAIKIGLIGCGGRGTGAVLDALGAATKVIYPSRATTPRTSPRGPRSRTRTSRSSPWPTCSTTGSTTCRGELGEDRHRHPQEPLLHRVRRLQETARDPRDQLRDPGHAAPLPPDAPEGRDRGRQERLHGEAGRRRRARRQHGHGGRRAGEEEEPRHRRRHPAAAPEELQRDDQAHPRRRDRRHRLRQGLLERRRRSGSSTASPAGATSSGRSATGTTSPGCAATTSSSSTSTTSTS